MHVLGPGVTISGPGPDGARDAFFEGETAYPTASNPWNGYIVVQAKCREQPRNNASDVAWLIAQLKREFAKLLDSYRALRKPDYFIVSTNVTLSSDPGRGGKQKIKDFIAANASLLHLRGWDVWSPDELRAYLDGAEEIRRRYTAWLQPGDVLLSLAETVKRRELSRLLPLALARDIREERDARFHDIAQDSERGVELDSIFVDLPLVEASGTSAKPTRVLARIIERCANCLAGSQGIQHSPSETTLGNRIVLIGGPGQGKSTIAQFIAQVARARLLQSYPGQINPQSSDAIEPILRCAEREGVPQIGPTRYPVRIDLPVFADALQQEVNKGTTLTLIQYIVSRFARTLSSDLDTDDVRKWLAVCPSVVILDGLDEIPRSGNRADVVAEINALFDELLLADSDVLVLVTTRPQGYDHDLNPKYWQHWELAPLASEDAVRYAERIAEARMSNVERRDQVVGEIRRASLDPVTAHLMISPLQVTILLGIASLKGTIPRNRWDVFERYFNLLRDREGDKPGKTAKMIRDYTQQIDILHRRAGYILHLSSEWAGGASAYLSREHFVEIVSDILREHEYRDEDARNISGELVRIATDRLVLLRERVEGQIAFDVRSLQEYMAAAELTGRNPQLIVKRLRAIALSSHWRHVFRIAASRIYSLGDFEYLRDDVLAICHSADSGDFGEEARLSRAGARLAADLALDGVADSVPRYHRQLCRRALNILEVGPKAFDARLALLVNDTTTLVFRDELVSRIRLGHAPAALAAWRAVFEILYVDRRFAIELIVEQWPADDPVVALHIISAIRTGALPRRIRDLLLKSQVEAGPAVLLQLHAKLYKDFVNGMRRAQWVDENAPSSSALAFRFVTPPSSQMSDVFQVLLSKRQSASTGVIVNLYSSDRIAEPGKPWLPQATNLTARQEWDEFAAIETFIRYVGVPGFQSYLPTRAALSALMSSFADIDIWGLPWILQTLVEDCRERGNWLEIASKADAGSFGDSLDWRRAEARWSHSGIQPIDFLTWQGGTYLTEQIALIGAPYIPASLVGGEWATCEDAARFIDVVRAVQQPARRAQLLESALNAMSSVEPRMAGTIQDVVLNTLPHLSGGRLVAFALAVTAKNVGMWQFEFYVEMADRIGRTFSLPRTPQPEIEHLAKAFNVGPNRRGLLAFLASGALSASQESISRAGPIDLDGSAFVEHAADEEPIKKAIAQLRVLTGRWDAADIPWLVTRLCGTPDAIDGSELAALTAHPLFFRHSAQRDLLVAIVRRVVEKRPGEEVLLVEQLAEIASSDQCALNDMVIQKELQLPPPLAPWAMG